MSPDLGRHNHCQVTFGPTCRDVNRASAGKDTRIAAHSVKFNWSCSRKGLGLPHYRAALARSVLHMMNDVMLLQPLGYIRM